VARFPGVLRYIGGYNASTNTPNLTSSPAGVKKGDTYSVSVDGSFFAATVEAGDLLISQQDNPTTLGHWAVAQSNIGGAIVDADFTGADGMLRKTAAGTYTVVKVNLAASAAPAVTDDGVAGYAVGSVWIDTTADKGYVCVDASTGAAVWIETTVAAVSVDPIGQKKSKLNATVAPAVTDDGVAGYAVGSVWIDVTADKAYVCLDSSTGAAVWIETTVAAVSVDPIGQKKSKLNATVAPAVTDDGTAGYAVGSVWIDTTADKAYVCVDSSTGAAVWLETTIAAVSVDPIGQKKSKLNATVAPAVTDDGVAGYAVGSVWIDTTADKGYVCLDASTGAAVWLETTVAAVSVDPIGQKKSKLDATAAPTVSDDGVAGYAVGSVWIDVTADKAYVCLDASTGAAVWIETTVAAVSVDPIGQKKSNLAASAAPTTAADNTAGYAVGSVWIDTTADKAYVCVDSSTGAAVWVETTVAGSAYVHPNHSGEVTSVADGATTIAANAVTLAKLATQAADTVLVNATSGAAVPTALELTEQTILGRITGGRAAALSAAQIRTLANVADGANAYVHPNHSGEVTSVADGATTIAANAVTLAKLATQAADTVLANATSGAAVPTAIELTEQTFLGRVTGGHVAALILDTDNTLAADSDARAVTQKAIKAYVAAHSGGGVVLHRENTVTPVANSTSETNLNTYTLPGGTLGTTGIIRVSAFGTLFNNYSATVRTLTLKLYLGTTAYLTADLSIDQNAGSYSWHLAAVLSAVDSESVQEFLGLITRTNSPSDAGTMVSATGPAGVILGTNNGAQNTANNLSLKCTATLSYANALVSCTCHSVVIEKL
jgi:outer membrane protein assembly factor BamB